MKINYTLAALFCAALTTGCNNEDEFFSETEQDIARPAPEMLFFAPNDGAQDLRDTPAKNVRLLLNKVGPSVAKGYGHIAITPAEAAEIKVFTDSLVSKYTSDKQKHDAITKWLYNNIEYKHEYEGGDVINNDPYPVFKTKTAICQGFSNLQHIMLESQGIPTLNVNGQLLGVGGHAWNYVYHSNKWWVSDATNYNIHQNVSIDALSKYNKLEPMSVDAPLFETEECVVDFSNYALNIDSIKTHDRQFIVPYSAGGFKITSLNPTCMVSTSLKEIFIGENIETLGEYYHGLEKNAPGIEAAYVAPENKKMESYSGAVYRKNGTEFQMYYIPGALKKLELKPMEIVDKNIIFDHQYVEEVIIPRGTKEIQDYAFEKCPNLRVAYVPEGVKIAEKAFWNVHPDFKLERKDLTGIPEIRL